MSALPGAGGPAVGPIERGFEYLSALQSPSGSFKGDYDGPLFLSPGYVFAHHLTGAAIPPDHARGLVAYARAAQNPDGGFGLHLEGRSYLFTTTLTYVALRLLGVPVGDPDAARARAFVLARGGATWVPTWGKYWLALLGLYDWEGVHPVCPELWLLPRWFPLHPGKYWCHCRMVYLPISHLYRRRYRGPETPLIAAIRAEIYGQPYAEVDFRAARSQVHPADRYVPEGRLLRLMNRLGDAAERLMPRGLRARALAFTLDAVRHEQASTSGIDIGPVSKAFDVVALHAAAPGSPEAERARARLSDYLFSGERGLAMSAYNSSELWDTGLVALALGASSRLDRFAPLARAAHRFIDHSQVREDVPDRERFFRDRSRGGFPFSTREHGWPIVDCTALGLLAALALAPAAEAPLDEARLLSAVDLLLGWQNRDGGFPTYEKSRGNALLERLNPSEIFGDIMVDYSYPELTSSALQALAAVLEQRPLALGGRRRAVERAIGRGARYLRGQQRADGSWEGAWGICFTYGTFFAVWGLRAAGADPRDPSLERAAAFLVARQRPDGGWGESHESCPERRYIEHPDGSQAVMTAWATLALLRTEAPGAREAAARGVRFLLSEQLPNGDFPRGGMTGVFSRTCMLNYRFYRNIFPLWALALAEKDGHGLGP